METKINLDEFLQSTLTQSEFYQSLELVKKGDTVVRLKTRENPQFKNLIYSMEIVSVKSVKANKITVDSPYANKFHFDGTQAYKGDDSVYGTNWYNLYTYSQALRVYFDLIHEGKRVNISEKLENIFRKIC